MVKRVPQKSRGKYRRRERKLILLAVEGRKNITETNYFNHFNREQSEYSIRFVPCNETDPVNLVNKAEEDWIKEKCDAKFGDLVYCVFDTDTDPEKQNEIDEAIRLTQRSHVEVVLSNPCFEVWYILHFKYSSGSFNSNDEVIKALRKYIPWYEKNKDVFPELHSNTQKAVLNARRLEQYHKDNDNRRGIARNPGTEVYRIVEKLEPEMEHSPRI